MVKRDGRGHSYRCVRGEILGNKICFEHLEFPGRFDPCTNQTQSCVILSKSHWNRCMLDLSQIVQAQQDSFLLPELSKNIHDIFDDFFVIAPKKLWIRCKIFQISI
uniref:Uncharacterized protein n=1 Tax=Onchocerca volvulus TaxID=6282 RepID=A0A8R1XSR8_ONCVO